MNFIGKVTKPIFILFNPKLWSSLILIIVKDFHCAWLTLLIRWIAKTFKFPLIYLWIISQLIQEYLIQLTFKFKLFVHFTSTIYNHKYATNLVQIIILIYLLLIFFITSNKYVMQTFVMYYICTFFSEKKYIVKKLQ